MKEAAGEANLTVVAIILIAVVVAVATPLVTSMMKSSGKRACCSEAEGYVWKANKCQKVDDSGQLDGNDHTSDVYDDTNGSCKQY